MLHEKRRNILNIKLQRWNDRKYCSKAVKKRCQRGAAYWSRGTLILTYIYTHIRMQALHTQLPNDCPYAEYNAKKMHSTPRCGITSIKAVRRMLHHEIFFFFQKFVICSVAQLHSYFCCIHDFVVFIFLWISYFSVNKRSTTKIDKAPRLKQRYAPCMISVASERGIATRACSGSCVHKMHFPIEIVFEQFGLHAKRNRAKIIEYK